jgi:carbamoyl-phosphate synthase large subunit
MDILFLNVGRRCELVQSFREALNKRGGGVIFGSDISPLAPGLQVVDYAEIFPKDGDKFKRHLVNYCITNAIELVIPTIDPDLCRLDDIREELDFCRLLIPPSFTIKHCRDKRLTKQLLRKLGVPVPRDVGAVFVKPFDGSAGVGARILPDTANDSLIVEEYIEGPEYTVDVLCDFSGKALIAIPRRRIKVRGGEVVQAIIERNRELEDMSMRIAEGFKAEGPITIQFIRRDETFYAIEVNARMGGGLPLTIVAGADWPGWIIDMCEGKKPEITDNITDGLAMTRHDSSFFILGEHYEFAQSTGRFPYTYYRSHQDN